MDPAKTNKSPPAINLRDLKHGWTAEPATAIEQLRGTVSVSVSASVDRHHRRLHGISSFVEVFEVVINRRSIIRGSAVKPKIGSVCPMAQIVTM